MHYGNMAKQSYARRKRIFSFMSITFSWIQPSPVRSAYLAKPLRLLHDNGNQREPQKMDSVQFSLDKNIGPSETEDGRHGHQMKPPTKHHTLTVCMVPPESANETWHLVSKARRQMKDPGYYRWPPHTNLLYPFINIKPDESDDNDLVDTEIVENLRCVTRNCEPFTVSLDRLGTFGGSKRGVLWLYPSSFRRGDEGGEPSGTDSNKSEPLIELQALLQEQFPICNDQQKVAGLYNPHMTVSHFVNLDAALQGKKEIEAWWPEPSSHAIHFELREIYLLQRKGDDGQFLRVASIPLGNNDKEVTIHNPPSPFCHMPPVEGDWVREERMSLKARRNRGSRRRGRPS